MSRDIRLQIVLRPEARHEDGVARVRAVLRSLGLEPSGAGRATVSARAGPRALAEVFDVTWSTGANRAGSSLPVPDQLQELVESITIAPHHIFFDRRPRGRGGIR